MNTTVRNYLIQLARKRTNQTVTYQKLSDVCRLKMDMGIPADRFKIGAVLEEVSLFEHDHGRPLLSSLVIRASDGEEGNGFYKLGERLKFGDWTKLKKDGIFEVEQMKLCIDFWINDTNYARFQ